MAKIAFIRYLCHPQLGVGGDGVLLIQQSEIANSRLRVFNSDGQEAEQCGNALRCAVDFIHRYLFLDSTNFLIETKVGVIHGCFEEPWIKIDLGPYRWVEEKLLLDNFGAVDLIDTGVPHLITFVSSLEISDFKERASELRSHPKVSLSSESYSFANVNFAQMIEDKIYVRTYERGVEGETLGCGTGAAAVAIAALKRRPLLNPICVVPLSQEEIFVEVFPDRVKICGKASMVFIGAICYSEGKGAS